MIMICLYPELIKSWPGSKDSPLLKVVRGNFLLRLFAFLKAQGTNVSFREVLREINHWSFDPYTDLLPGFKNRVQPMSPESQEEQRKIVFESFRDEVVNKQVGTTSNACYNHQPIQGTTFRNSTCEQIVSLEINSTQHHDCFNQSSR